jgi:hypothetical protein
MNMKMKRTLFTLLAASVAALANPVNANKDLLESKADSINAKRGFEIGGAIRAVAQRSSFDTDQDLPSRSISQPTEERNEFVTADIDFHFRPYEEVRANVMLRLGGGMQEYFAAAAKTLTVAWINVEGNVGNSFYWIVGDFRQQYSPLTLYLPGIDIMYEPTVFARKRYMAQKEQMIEGNQRNLQGVNLQFRTNLGDAVGEVRAEGLFARVNRTSVLDFSGAEGNIMPNGTFPGATQASNMDKWLAAGNFELLPLNRNLYVGVTPMYIFDNKNTYAHNAYRHPSDGSGGFDVDGAYERGDVNPFDASAQKTIVVSGRLGGDVAGFLGSKTLVADLVAEGAMSIDNVEVGDIDAATGAIKTKEESEKGMAILATANVGYKVENSFGVVATVDFIRNDSSWYNNLAQSSNFFAQRIMNSDVDYDQVRFGVNAPLYSTFDALYNFSPKFAPVATTLGTDDNKTKGGQTESYNIGVYNKNSWTTNVYTHAQLALLEKLADPNVQLVLPNGLATSNRMGARAVLTGNWKDLAELQGMFSTFNQVKALYGFKEAKYMEYGGGAKWDIFKTVGFQRPLEISGSYKHSERSLDYDPALGTSGTAEFKSNFINAGLYLQYLPRLGFTAGFQMITSEINDQQADLDSKLNFFGIDRKKNPILKGTQKQWMVGLDYAMEEHAWLSVNVGQIMVKNEYSLTMGGAPGTYTSETKNGNTVNTYTETSNPSMNLPAYYYADAAAVPAKFTHEFTQMLFEASINVEF